MLIIRSLLLREATLNVFPPYPKFGNDLSTIRTKGKSSRVVWSLIDTLINHPVTASR